MFLGKLVTPVALAIGILAAPAHAEPDLGVLSDASSRIERSFDCSDFRETSGYWTCQTEIEFARGQGAYPVDIQINYRSYDNDAVVSYEMKVFRPLIRPESFEVFVSFARFVAPELEQVLMQADAAQAYGRGQTKFPSNGLVVIANDNSDAFSVKIISEADDRSFDLPAPCPHKTTINGWQVTYSKNIGTAEPSMRQLEPEMLISGQFRVLDSGVKPVFGIHRVFSRSLAHTDPAPYYLTVLSDGRPIYQGQWVEKREPTCCTTTLNPAVPAETFQAFEGSRVGAIVLSRDKEMTRRVAAAEFDSSNAWSAINFAQLLRNDIRERLGPGTGCR